MKTKLALLLVSVLLLPQCGNVINELIPREAEDDPLPPVYYRVAFNKNGADADAVPASNTAAYGGTVSLPATNPAWTDHAFEGWWTENGSGGNWGAEFTASTPVTENIIVYARWNPPPVYYTVWFNHNNSDPGSTGANPAVMQTAAGTEVSPMPIPPTRPGYIFGSWHTSPDGGVTLGVAVFTASTVVTADISVYARWMPVTYTVTFDTNGGTTDASPPAKTVIFPQTTIDALPMDPVWAGRAFLGWRTENGSGGIWGDPFTASTTVAADITVYAEWNPPPAYKIVTFHKNGGDTEADPQTRITASGGTVELPGTEPTRTGLFFDGWYKSADGGATLGVAFTENTPVPDDITVYAKWSAAPVNPPPVVAGRNYTFTLTFAANPPELDMHIRQMNGAIEEQHIYWVNPSPPGSNIGLVGGGVTGPTIESFRITGADVTRAYEIYVKDYTNAVTAPNNNSRTLSNTNAQLVMQDAVGTVLFTWNIIPNQIGNIWHVVTIQAGGNLISQDSVDNNDPAPGFR